MLESHAAGAIAVARETSEPPPASGSTPRPRLHLGDQAADVRERLAERLRRIRRQFRRERAKLIDQCLSVDARTAGSLFGLSERAWRRLDVTDKVPRPVKIYRSVRWQLKELSAWTEAGCPDRAAWEAMK